MPKAVETRLVDFLTAAIEGRNDVAGDIPGEDWDSVWTMARDHCIVPYLHSRWSNSGLFSVLPQSFAARMTRAATANSERNRRLLRTLGELRDSLERAGIPLLVSKGLPVSHEYYGDLGLRVLYDLDLIVQPSHRSAAAGILERHGYQRYFPARRIPEDEGELFWRPQPFAWGPDRVFEPDQPVFVELHTSPWVRGWHGFEIDCRLDLWEGHRMVDLSGVAVRVPPAEKLLVHLAVHYACNVLESSARLMHLLDIVLILQQRRDALDWEGIWREVADNGIAPLCGIAFALAERMQGPGIPEPVGSRIRSAMPSAIRDWLGSRALRDVARVNVHHRDQALIYFLHWHLADAWSKKLRVLAYSCRAPLSETAGGLASWKILARRMAHRARHLARASQM